MGVCRRCGSLPGGCEELDSWDARLRGIHAGVRRDSDPSLNAWFPCALLRASSNFDRDSVFSYPPLRSPIELWCNGSRDGHRDY